MVHNDTLNVTTVSLSFIFLFFFAITDLKNFSLCNVIQQIKKRSRLTWPFTRQGLHIPVNWSLFLVDVLACKEEIIPFLTVINKTAIYWSHRPVIMALFLHGLENGENFPVREFWTDWKSQRILLKILEKMKYYPKYWKSEGILVIFLFLYFLWVFDWSPFVKNIFVFVKFI